MTRNASLQPRSPEQATADALGEHIDGGLQGSVDLAHCRDGCAGPDFLLKRLRCLFGRNTPESYRIAYCRAWQKAIERGAGYAA